MSALLWWNCEILRDLWFWQRWWWILEAMGCLTQKTKAMRFFETSKQLNIPDWLELMVKERVSKRREANVRCVGAVALPTKSNGREYNANFACTWPQEVRLPSHVVTQSVYWKMAVRPAYSASQSCSKNMVVLQLFLRWACTRNFIRNKSTLLSVGPCLSVAY